MNAGSIAWPHPSSERFAKNGPDRETALPPSAWPQFKYCLSKWCETTSENFKRVIQRSDYYARVNLGVMLALQSRYSLTIYDLGCLIINRQNRTVRMSVKELRRRIGVPEGSLKNFAELRREVLAKSKAEIDQLADFMVEWEEIRGSGRGRPVQSVKMTFMPKDSSAQEEAARELDRPKAGRRARREGTTEALEVLAPPLPPARAGEARKAPIPSAGRQLFPEGSLHFCGDNRLLAILGDFGGGWDKDLVSQAYREQMGARLEKLSGEALYKSFEGFCRGFVKVRGKA